MCKILQCTLFIIFGLFQTFSVNVVRADTSTQGYIFAVIVKNVTVEEINAINFGVIALDSSMVGYNASVSSSGDLTHPGITQHYNHDGLLKVSSMNDQSLGVYYYFARDMVLLTRRNGLETIPVELFTPENNFITLENTTTPQYVAIRGMAEIRRDIMPGYYEGMYEVVFVAA